MPWVGFGGIEFKFTITDVFMMNCKMKLVDSQLTNIGGVLEDSMFLPELMLMHTVSVAFYLISSTTYRN